jgi:hypothetical protein
LPRSRLVLHKSPLPWSTNTFPNLPDLLQSVAERDADGWLDRQINDKLRSLAGKLAIDEIAGLGRTFGPPQCTAPGSLFSAGEGDLGARGCSSSVSQSSRNDFSLFDVV